MELRQAILFDLHKNDEIAVMGVGHPLHNDYLQYCMECLQKHGDSVYSKLASLKHFNLWLSLQKSQDQPSG